MQGTTIHQALVDKYGFTGSYWSVIRYLKVLAEKTPVPTTVIEFAPGDAAQVDFGAGPLIVDTQTGELRKSWIFVDTGLRHIYAEFIRDQSVATWLACHRRAFEWFNGCPNASLSTTRNITNAIPILRCNELMVNVLKAMAF